MLSGATKKQVCFCLCGFLRIISAILLFVAFIIVLCVVKPPIVWLNILLGVLTLTCIVSGVYNIVLCGSPASAYKANFWNQIVCFVITIFTGGVLSTILSGVAVFEKVSDEEVKNERLVNIKKLGKDGK